MARSLFQEPNTASIDFQSCLRGSCGNSSPVFSLHSFFSSGQVAQIEEDCRSAGIGCVQCKRLFAKNLIDYFAPFRERRAALAADPDQVWDILADGARRASVIAAETIAEVKATIGLP